MVFEIKQGKTPFGGDYTEIYYFNNEMFPCEKEAASRCIVRECKNGGILVNEQILVLQKKGKEE